MTSFALAPERAASEWISSFSSRGTRRRTTGLAPASTLPPPAARLVGHAQALGENAGRDVVDVGAAACGLADERALQMGGHPDRMPVRDEVLAAKLLALYQRTRVGRGPNGRGLAVREDPLRRGLSASSRSWRRTNQIRWTTVTQASAAST